MTIKVIYNELIEETVSKTNAQKSIDVLGESFIIDWSSEGYNYFKHSCELLTQAFSKKFIADFIGQKNHHSTILSKRLDSIDITTETIIPLWRDNDFSICRTFFSENFRKFVLKLESCVIAPIGTVQLVFRDEIILPQTRILLKSLGATVKSGTIEGDRINTCTVVLGYFKSNSESISESKICPIVYEWLEKYGIDKINVHTISLVRYFDLSLNRYSELVKF